MHVKTPFAPCVGAGENDRRQYMGHVLGVQKPCTRSTKPMYLEYKAHVLRPGKHVQRNEA